MNKREDFIFMYETWGNLLTQTQKQAIHLYLIEDLSLGEIAKITATTRSAVYDAIKKGKRKLENIKNKLE